MKAQSAGAFPQSFQFSRSGVENNFPGDAVAAAAGVGSRLLKYCIQ